MHWHPCERPASVLRDVSLGAELLGRAAALAFLLEGQALCFPHSTGFCARFPTSAPSFRALATPPFFYYSHSLGTISPMKT